MVVEELSSEERFVLSQISWRLLTTMRPEEEAACERLEAEGLLNKVANGRWELTAAGRFRAACGR